MPRSCVHFAAVCLAAAVVCTDAATNETTDSDDPPLSGLALAKAYAAVVKRCGGGYNDLVNSNKPVDSDCFEALKPVLPKPSSNYAQRVFALGAMRDQGGATVYVQGVTNESKLLTATDYNDAIAHPLSSSGEALAGLGGVSRLDAGPSALSISFVVDYSLSMSEETSKSLANLLKQVPARLPAGYEAEVIKFADDAHRKLFFTEDETALDAELSYDTSYKRGRTALWDAMGSAAMSLASRNRPMRVLIVATDGIDSNSQTWSAACVEKAIAEGRVFLVVLGSFFSLFNRGLVSLTIKEGVYFYGPRFSDAAYGFGKFVDMLGVAAGTNGSSLRLDSLPSQATSVNITVRGMEGKVQLPSNKEVAIEGCPSLPKQTFAANSASAAFTCAWLLSLFIL
jgi:hypothetical protein